MRKLLREKITEIKSLGFTVEGYEQARGSHFKVFVRSRVGVPLTLVVATSPSSVRAERNFSAFLRRLRERIG